jgi:hypothetical protein
MGTLPPFDVWARTKDSKIVIASNTKEIPDLPCWNPPAGEVPWPRIDGKWGMDEYSVIPQPFDKSFPYLAWMPTQRFARLGIPTKVISFQVIEDTTQPNSMFVRHSGWTHRGYLKTELREELQTEVVHYIDLVAAIILEEADSSTRSGPAEVRPPVIALVRAHNSAFCMRFLHLTYRDLLEYMAGLQRSVAELQAYVLWHDRIQYGNIPASTRSFELGLRGSIAQNPTDYNALRKLGVPVWLELSQADMSLFDVRKRVELMAMRVETRKWDDMSVSQFLRDTRKGKLVHNKPLEYYPPAVDANTAYESAARGYSPRRDVICRDFRSLQDVLKMVETGGEFVFASWRTEAAI